MEQFVPIILDALNYTSVLLLVSIGLIIVFGMMQVINLAHGEFFLIGAYSVLVAQGFGLPFWIVVPMAFFITLIVGLCVDACILRFIYHRPMDTILATWGLSIAIKQLMIIIFGAGAHQVSAPITEPVEIFGVVYSSYRLVIMAITLVITVATLSFLYFTRFGLAARAAMANRQMAQCLGINTRRLDRTTFGLGAGLAGVAGAVMAPLMSVDPQMGLSFLVPAFLTVLVGGASSPLGALYGSAVIGTSNTLIATWWTPVIAQITVFTLAIVVIRTLPSGIAGLRRS